MRRRPAAATRTGTGQPARRIGRGEYRWKMLGGDWQFAAEAAFNSLDRGVAHLFALDPTGTFDEIPFPGGTGGVTEDRYEVDTDPQPPACRATSRSSSAGGGEYSKLAQTGPQRPRPHVPAAQGLGHPGVDTREGPRPLAQARAQWSASCRSATSSPSVNLDDGHRQRRQRRAGAAAELGARLREPRRTSRQMGLGHAHASTAAGIEDYIDGIAPGATRRAGRERAAISTAGHALRRRR